MERERLGDAEGDGPTITERILDVKMQYEYMYSNK
jgi:hypothetical protein